MHFKRQMKKPMLDFSLRMDRGKVYFDQYVRHKPKQKNRTFVWNGSIQPLFIRRYYYNGEKLNCFKKIKLCH